MKRIHKAVNNAIFESSNNILGLMQLGNKPKNPTLQKQGISGSQIVKNAAYDFQPGDLVYYNDSLGYNKISGGIVAVCAGPNLYVVTDQDQEYYRWAEEDTPLYDKKVKGLNSGLLTTRHICKKYYDYTYDTLWDQLEPDEYIPSIDELTIIYRKCAIDPKFQKLLGITMDGQYWSCTNCDDIKSMAKSIDFETGQMLEFGKEDSLHIIKMFDIDYKEAK